MKWPLKRLDELGHVARGRSRHRPRNDPCLFNGPYPFIQTAEVMGADPYISGFDQTLSEFGFAQSKLWPADTLCITIAGANTAQTAIMKISACFPDSVIGFRADPSKSDLQFVKYALDMMKGRFRAITRGATQDNLSLDKLLSFGIPAPTLAEQQRIGSILSSYDDLIDVNRRRIAILEEMGRRLFEEWFVRFRFPGRADLVETAEGIVPQGWSFVRLSDILSTLEAGSRPKGGIKNGTGDVPSIGAENINGLGAYDFRKEKLIPRTFFATMRRGIVRSGDVLLYKDGAHVGRKAMFRDGYPHVECAVNEHVFILRPKLPITPHYLYFWLDQPEVTSRIKALNSNAAQPGLNQPGINSLAILQPSSLVLAQFTEVVEPMLALLFCAAKANARLSLSRDLLLPSLISGELSIAGAERELEAVA